MISIAYEGPPTKQMMKALIDANMTIEPYDDDPELVRLSVPYFKGCVEYNVAKLTNRRTMVHMLYQLIVSGDIHDYL